MELFANDLFGQNVRISDRRNRTIEAVSSPSLQKLNPRRLLTNGHVRTSYRSD
jgi:hypothetical protein